jgi:hypothetical protein
VSFRLSELLPWREWTIETRLAPEDAIARVERSIESSVFVGDRIGSFVG